MTTPQPVVLYSKTDPSINIITPEGFETRYVCRDDGNEVIIYLSSFNGCDQACRMCWLTQQGQTSMEPATAQDFVNQARMSIQAYLDNRPEGVDPEVIHFNWMARGEPLLNDAIMKNWPTVSAGLIALVEEMLDGLPIKFKISTVFPDLKTYSDDLAHIPITGLKKLPFTVNKPEIYYSLYSINPTFRKNWLPKAEDYREAMRLLSDYKTSGGEVRIHSAFIKLHNDDLLDLKHMLTELEHYGLKGKFNIVRFNSIDETKYQEIPESDLVWIENYIRSRGWNVQTIGRVGQGVFASCGQFVHPDVVGEGH